MSQLPSSSGGRSFWPLLAIGAVAAGGYWLYDHYRRRRNRAALDRLLARDPKLEYTVIPFGLRSDELAWWCRGLPDGDRNNGVRYAVQGAMRADLGPGLPEEFDVVAFEWWWEEERSDRSRDRTGFRRPGFHTTQRRHAERRTPAAIIRLPVTVDSRVMIEPASVLGRLGVTRAGHQFESAEFNRLFRIEALNHDLALALIDANVQQLMVEHFPGRTVELFGDLLLVAGTPTHRDESLPGVIGMLPALRQDAHRVLRAVPAAYWRAVGAITGGR